MNKKLIRLTEADLHRIVKESVEKIVNEIPSKGWSNEDEEFLEETLSLLEGHRSRPLYGELKNWLKSLKYRIN